MNWSAARLALGTLGRVLIAAGMLILAFVGYQLWGTSFAEARSQERLVEEFRGGPTALEAIRAVPGGAVGLIEIPKIGLDKAIVEGVGVAELKQGPGHYPRTPMPGQPGNAAIAGHRTTYGAPFNRLDELVAGDIILVTTAQGEFRYEVESAAVVNPKQSEVLDNTADSRLTLTTCHPEFSAAQRLILTAKLATPAATPIEVKPDSPTSIDSLDAGLSGDPTARWPAFAWGLAAATVAACARVGARYWRRIPSYLIGAPIFLVTLFIFFENFARLLPANV
ncbi:MAG TPA: class E sortase [Acidimicrobiales bacterium]|nr:class E sortase [Acidimicrobiales bacterium]